MQQDWGLLEDDLIPRVLLFLVKTRYFSILYPQTTLITIQLKLISPQKCAIDINSYGPEIKFWLSESALKKYGGAVNPNLDQLCHA